MSNFSEVCHLLRLLHQNKKVNKFAFNLLFAANSVVFIMTDTEVVGDATLKEQQARATLRELFLKGIGELTGKPCKIVTYEKTTLNATFAAWHPDGSEIIFRDLETPAHFHISTALLRTPDVLAVEFDQPVDLP